jgi:hypothetical protein
MIEAYSRKIAIFILAGISPSFAQSPPLSGLSKLDPQTRLDQVCDIEAMNRIKRESDFRPDRAKSYASTTPKTQGDTVVAKGAAFRSNGKWYEFSFVCKGSPDHMKVLSFDYKIGKPVPESKWDDYGLWR